MNIIETRNLTKIYANKHISLNGANLDVPKGSVFGLVGPNGAGKTTTIRLLLGLHSASAGTIRIFGEPMTPNAVQLRQRIGFLPTNPRFPEDMNAITYLDFVGKLFSLPSEIRTPRLAGLLRAVGLLSASSQRIKSFSTGMVTRLGIAASLMNDPELLIWDEPTAGLDPEARKDTIDLIEELGQTKTIVVSSHHLGDIKRVCNHIGILSDGKLIYNGPLREMLRQTPHSAMELEVAGNLEALRPALAALVGLRWKLETGSLRLYFDEQDAIAAGLNRVLALLTEHDVKLLAINSLEEEMVNAFIHLLEAERAHGFSRILTLETQDDAVSGAAGS